MRKSSTGSPHSRSFYITCNNTPQSVGLLRTGDKLVAETSRHSQQTSIPPVGFEPTISAGEWPQIYALEFAATGTGPNVIRVIK